MAKANNATAALRCTQVYGLLCQGKSRADIVQFAAEQWSISDRQTDSYIARAREMLMEDCNLSRPAFLAEALARLRKYEQKAADRGQLMVAINSVQLQVKLLRFELS